MDTYWMIYFKIYLVYLIKHLKLLIIWLIIRMFCARFFPPSWLTLFISFVSSTGALKNVDKSLFRRAVWVYIHYIFGIRYDDYDYNQIKKLLTKPLRNFIKIVCMHPERISKKDYDSITKEFSHSERVRVFRVLIWF